MALGDVIASMPLVKQGLFFTCRGGVLASLATGVRQCTCVCVCVTVNQSLSTLPLASNRGSRSGAGAGATLAGATFFAALPSVLATPWAPSILVHLVASTCQNGIGRRNCKHAIGEARTVRRVSWGCIGIASILIVRALKAVPQAVV